MLAMGMASCLVAGLSACGKGGDSKENAALAKEHVYRLQEFEIPDLGGDDYDVMSTYRQDGTSYIMVQVYDWSSSNNERNIKLLCIEESTGETNLIPMELPGAGYTDTGNTDPGMAQPMPRVTDNADVADTDTSQEDGDSDAGSGDTDGEDADNGDAGSEDGDSDAGSGDTDGEDADNEDTAGSGDEELAVPDIGIDTDIEDNGT